MKDLSSYGRGYFHLCAPSLRLQKLQLLTVTTHSCRELVHDVKNWGVTVNDTVTN